MDEHRQNLGSLCRICTKKLGRVSYSIQEKAGLVEECFHISVSSDNPDIHPGRFCNSCKLTMRRMTNARAKGVVYRTSLELHSTWEDHQEEGCSTCGMVAGRKTGGRPKKRPNIIGCPSDLTAHIRSIAGPKHRCSTPLTPERFFPLSPHVPQYRGVH